MGAVLNNARNYVLAGALSIGTIFGVHAQSPANGNNVLAANDGGKPKTEVPAKNITIKKADFRSKPYASAGLASCSSTATREGDAKQNTWITILVRSDDPELHASIESTIKGLYAAGHTNVALMQGATSNGQTEVGIYWDGGSQYSISNARPNNNTGLEIASIVIQRNRDLGLVTTYDNKSSYVAQP